MNAVRHRPVAEQYPSSTATVSALASKRISGMEGWSRRFPGDHASTHSATWRASHTAHHAETRAMVVPNIMRPATARVPHSRQRTEGRRAARARCRLMRLARWGCATRPTQRLAAGPRNGRRHWWRARLPGSARLERGGPRCTTDLLSAEQRRSSWPGWPARQGSSTRYRLPCFPLRYGRRRLSPCQQEFGDKRCTDGCGLLGRIVYRQTEHI